MDLLFGSAKKSLTTTKVRGAFAQGLQLCALRVEAGAKLRWSWRGDCGKAASCLSLQERRSAHAGGIGVQKTSTKPQTLNPARPQSAKHDNDQGECRPESQMCPGKLLNLIYLYQRTASILLCRFGVNRDDGTLTSCQKDVLPACTNM